MNDRPTLADHILEYYNRGREEKRLEDNWIEFARTQQLLRRFLPPPPADVIDIGGGTGVHAFPIAELGYAVHLIEPVPLHIQQAKELSSKNGVPLAQFVESDARALPFAAGTFDATLLLGPLYHLPEAEDRRTCLAEAYRVLRSGGQLFAAAISRFSIAIDGLAKGLIGDPEFVDIVLNDLATGQHNPSSDGSRYFTTAYFHRPEEFQREIEAAGFLNARIKAIEGPFEPFGNNEVLKTDPAARNALFKWLDILEDEPSLLGASGHMMAIAQKP